MYKFTDLYIYTHIVSREHRLTKAFCQNHRQHFIPGKGKKTRPSAIAFEKDKR